MRSAAKSSGSAEPAINRPLTTMAMSGVAKSATPGAADFDMPMTSGATNPTAIWAALIS